MIQVKSKLKVVDNSGGKWATCISVKKKESILSLQLVFLF